jgi:hypothetical protein
MGCCDENGECLAGTGLLACGVGGGACAVCEANQACHEGVCGLIDGGDYDAHFPERPDAWVNYDAGVFDGGSGTDAGQADAGASDAGSDAGTLVRYASEVQPIFDARCNSCHSWSYSTTVNVATNCGGAGSVRIKPGRLDESRLYGKVSGAPACGGPMPPGGALDATQLDVIARWILQGAPDN